MDIPWKVGLSSATQMSSLEDYWQSKSSRHENPPGEVPYKDHKGTQSVSDWWDGRYEGPSNSDSNGAIVDLPSILKEQSLSFC